MRSLDQRGVNEAVWRACERFQGASLVGSIQSHAIAMLLWKYISDVWEDLCEEYQKKYDGDSELIERRLARERFQIPAGCGIATMWKCQKVADIGARVNMALRQIEEANHRNFQGLFSGVDFDDETKLGPRGERNLRLRVLLEDFNDGGIEFRPSIVSGRVEVRGVCENLLERFAFCPGRKRGSAYTPRQVSRLLARLLNPKKGDTICDPVCGSGSLLSVVGHHADELDFSLYGQERDALTHSICRANLFLQGIDSYFIELGDTIREPLLLEGDRLKRFDVVVGHLPVSTDNWGREVARGDPFFRFDRGVPPRSKGEYAFILHMIRIAREEAGRVGVVVPHGVLFRGAAEGEIRRRLVEDNLLEAVIGLPAKLMSGTGAPVAVLLFNLAKCHRDVLLVDASKGFAVGRHQNCLGEEHIERIVSTYRSFDTVECFSRRVTLNEIAENEFSLEISRYVKSGEENEPIDSRILGKEIEQLEGELAEVRAQMSQCLQELCG